MARAGLRRRGGHAGGGDEHQLRRKRPRRAPRRARRDRVVQGDLRVPGRRERRSSHGHLDGEPDRPRRRAQHPEPRGSPAPRASGAMRRVSSATPRRKRTTRSARLSRSWATAGVPPADPGRPGFRIEVDGPARGDRGTAGGARAFLRRRNRRHGQHRCDRRSGVALRDLPRAGSLAARRRRLRRAGRPGRRCGRGSPGSSARIPWPSTSTSGCTSPTTPAACSYGTASDSGRRSPCAPTISIARTAGSRAGESWPCDLGPELSRGFRALKVWFALKENGSEGSDGRSRRTAARRSTWPTSSGASPASS